MTTNRMMTNREQIAFNREQERLKAQLRKNVIDVLRSLLYGVICVVSNAFATQMMLFVLSVYHVHMGFAMGFVITMIATMVISVGTFIGVKFAK